MTGKITLKGLREDTIEKTENHSTTTADESEGEVSEVEDMREVRSIEIWLSLINQSINQSIHLYFKTGFQKLRRLWSHLTNDLLCH